MDNTTNSPNPKPTSLFLNFSDPNNLYRVDHRDNTTLILVTDLLTIENYVIWSRSMCQALRARNNLGLLMGALSSSQTLKTLYLMLERGTIT